jgi:hypothetical protein
MGNTHAPTAGETATSEGGKGKWRTGNKVGAIPSPFASAETYEKLAKLSEFKDFLGKNLDSDYLISSILVESEDGSAFLEGIESFKNLAPEMKEEMSSRISNFELATAAGVDVSYFHVIDCMPPLSASLILPSSIPYTYRSDEPH